MHTTHRRPSLRALLSWLALLSLLCVALLGSQCNAPPPPAARTWTDTPQGFVEVQTYNMRYKAVSPDGAVIGVRSRPNDEKGDLAFWLEVFNREMTEGKGYLPAPSKPDAPTDLAALDIQSADGVPGKLLSFSVPDDRSPYRYQLALFISADHIITFESLCEEASCDRHAPAFAAALKTLRATTDDPQKSK
jgi:hypothetical protein